MWYVILIQAILSAPGAWVLFSWSDSLHNQD